MSPRAEQARSGADHGHTRAPNTLGVATCAAAVGVGALGASCIAVHWTGSDGVDRHLGAVMCTVEAMHPGRRVTTTSLGLDLDLSASGRGLSIGFVRRERWEPLTCTTTADLLADDVASYLRDPRAWKPPNHGAPPGTMRVGAGRSTRFLWSSDPNEFSPTLTRRFVGGASIGVGRENRGLDIGIALADRIVGLDPLDDVVQLRITDRGDDGLLMWRICDQVDPRNTSQTGP